MLQQLRATGVTGLCQHSNRVIAGDAFVAYPGSHSDGRNFISDAIQRGAKALVIDPEHLTPQQEAVLSQVTVPIIRIPQLAQQIPGLADDFYDNPSRHMHMIAVTGTNGKSSIVYGLNQMYRALDVSVAMIGTLGIGTLDHCKDNPLTTPDPISLQRHLAEMYQEGIETVAMEASSHALDQGRLKTTDIRVAIFTNLTQEHLDYHHTLEAYGKAKALLYQMSCVETVVINLDDPWCFVQIDLIPASKKIIGYTCQGKTHPRCDTIIAATPQDDGYRVTEGETSVFFTPQLLGAFNISNLLAMIGAMRVDGFGLNVLVQVASKVSGIPGRLECVSQADDPRVIVDFAHTPDALLKALLAARESTQGQLWCVFGCGGGRDTGKRPVMGEIAAKYADKVIVTTDNSRDESSENITDMILTGMPSSKPPQVILDRAKAIHTAIALALPQDSILIAGKGHEKTQTIAGVVTPFSDQATAREALEIRRQG